MRYKKSSWLIILVVLSLVLSACNMGKEAEPTPDVGAIFTAAAETVMAEFSVKLTQTAQVAPTATQAPTNTAPATFAVVSPGAAVTPVLPATTPLATFGIGTQPVAGVLPTITSAVVIAPTTGDTCYNSEFVTDVNYPDGTVVEGSKEIAKSWRLKNTGTCTWDDGFSLQPVTGEAMGGKAWVIDTEDEFVKPGETVDIVIEMVTPSSSGDHGGCWRMMGDGGYYFGTLACILIKVK